MSVAARFMEAGGPVYVLVGSVPAHVIGSGRHPFTYFETPRSEGEALAWLRKYSWAPRRSLRRMVEASHIIRVNTAHPQLAAASFIGVHLVALAEAAPDESALPHQVAVRRSAAEPETVGYITGELAEVLWGHGIIADIPTAIGSVNDVDGMGAGRIARRVLSGLPFLLKNGLARLEWMPSTSAHGA